MFTVIYTFRAIEGRQDSFIEAWSELTKLIYKHEGSLGSRLHHESGVDYIAYAQWPDEETWDKAGGNLPAIADKWRQQMRESCEEIKTIHKLEVVEDLLQSKAFTK